MNAESARFSAIWRESLFPWIWSARNTTIKCQTNCRPFSHSLFSDRANGCALDKSEVYTVERNARDQFVHQNGQSDKCDRMGDARRHWCKPIISANLVSSDNDPERQRPVDDRHANYYFLICSFVWCRSRIHIFTFYTLSNCRFRTAMSLDFCEIIGGIYLDVLNRL